MVTPTLDTPHTPLAFTSLARFVSRTSQPLRAAETCLWRCCPTSAPLHTPRLNHKDIFPKCGREEGWKLVESTYPAAFHPSDPWCTSGSCWTLEGGKGNKMRKAAALVRPYIPLWSAGASDSDPCPADWFIKHLLKTLPFLLVYKWPFFKKKSWIVFGLWTFRLKILAEVCMLNDLQPVICVSGVMWREVEYPESSLHLLKAAVAQHLFKNNNNQDLVFRCPNTKSDTSSWVSKFDLFSQILTLSLSNCCPVNAA